MHRLEENNKKELQKALMAIGLAQCNVSAHVDQEYCRADRSFVPKPTFNEKTLPRTLTFYNFTTQSNNYCRTWYRLCNSPS